MSPTSRRSEGISSRLTPILQVIRPRRKPGAPATAVRVLAGQAVRRGLHVEDRRGLRQSMSRTLADSGGSVGATRLLSERATWVFSCSVMHVSLRPCTRLITVRQVHRERHRRPERSSFDLGQKPNPVCPQRFSRLDAQRVALSHPLWRQRADRPPNTRTLATDRMADVSRLRWDFAVDCFALPGGALEPPRVPMPVRGRPIA